MSELITGLTPEPRFPHSDIGADNAYMLSVLLRQPSELKIFHSMAEASMRRYALGHTALNRTAVNTLYNSKAARAMGVGIAIYEAMATLLKPETTDIDEKGIAIIGATPLMQEAILFEYLETAKDDFLAKMPTAADVVKDAAQCLIDDEFYAIVGAAAARQLEIDTTNL